MLRAKSVRKKTPPFRTLTRCNRSSGKSLRISFAIARTRLRICPAVINTRILSLCNGCALRLAPLVVAIFFIRSTRDLEPRLYPTYGHKAICATCAKLQNILFCTRLGSTLTLYCGSCLLHCTLGVFPSSVDG